MSYSKTQIVPKTYAITADVDGSEETFICTVASTQAELDALVEFRMAEIRQDRLGGDRYGSSVG